MSYEDSLAAEKKIYENNLDVHSLPPIFHYWSERHLLPKFNSFGFNSPNDMFLKNVDTGVNPARIVSLGAGNCDLEIEIARSLQAKDREFTIDCVEINPAMLRRGEEAAQQAGVRAHLQFITADLNTWQASHEYTAAIANQSLHHVVNLEGLFEQVKQSLLPGGKFLISDMIGRNGHQRWPEALAIVHEFWRKLPPSYRFNEALGDFQELHQSWDCSTEGFEGIRAQDILGLLINQFHFHLFLPYGNVIDPFIDRGFGPHFDPAMEWDRAFIDAVHLRDEKEIQAGRITPTHMVAAVANEPCSSPRYPENLSPRFCLRAPEKIVAAAVEERPQSPYDWESSGHDPYKELEIVCRRLAQTGPEITRRAMLTARLQSEFEGRTAWALSLENRVRSDAALVSELQGELEARTQWALGLEADVERLTALALSHEAEVRERTAWALGLERQLEERTAWALSLESDLGEQTARAEHLQQKLDRRLSARIRRLFS